jgi:hypothetical protein
MFDTLTSDLIKTDKAQELVSGFKFLTIFKLARFLLKDELVLVKEI